MNYERIHHSIGVLERVGAEQLPYQHRCWVGDEDRPYDCNTAACAACWIARDEWTRSQGLVIITEQPDGSSFPAYRDAEEYEALADYYDISEDEAEYLFSPDRYDDALDVTPEMVVARMRKLLASYSTMAETAARTALA